MPKVIPTNKHLLVEKVTETYKEESIDNVKVLLPEEYSQEPNQEHTCYKVRAVPDKGLDLDVKVGTVVIAETYAVKEIKVYGDVYSIVPQGNVVAVVVPQGNIVSIVS